MSSRLYTHGFIRSHMQARAGNVHHENRFAGRAVIGLATWPRDRIAGLKQVCV